MHRVIHKDLAFLQCAKSALSETLQWKDNGFGRRFAEHIHIDESFKKEVFAEFGIDEIIDEPMFGNFVGNHYLDGAFVHQHKDGAPEGYHHVRCNIALEMPEEGGCPILDEKTVTVSKGDIWICFASIERHSSTPIRNGQRLVLSLGSLVRKELAESVYQKLSHD
jgi:hypothetical protein